jgi:acetolactate synthase-1/2/3 large subunit
MQGWGKVTTVVAPANHAWEESTNQAPALITPEMETVSAITVSEIAGALSSGKVTALFLGGRALREDSLAAAGLIAKATGARIICETFPARLQRGAGRVPVERLPYFAEQAAEVLGGLEQLVLVGASVPVSFFAYPGKDSLLAPDNCEILKLADVHQDTAAALQAVAREIGASVPAETARSALETPPPCGVLSPLAIAQSLVQLMPENAIVSDEAATCGLPMFSVTENAPPHEWMTITGDVTVVIMNNRSYAILNIELARVGAGQPTPKTLSMFDLSRPDINWVEISEGMGVPATRATTAEEFHQQFAEAMMSRGPRLIEAMVVQQMP